MREEILNELLSEYESLRAENEREEMLRREKIRKSFPEIEQKLEDREALVFGTIRKVLSGTAQADNLTRKMSELNRTIGRMLKENGLPENYLEPVYRCTACKDTGYTGEPVREPCDCLKKAYQKKLRDEIGLNRNDEEVFENFLSGIIPDEPVDDSGVTQRSLTEFAKSRCEKWADTYPDPPTRDMLLTGMSGLGKTFLMHAMAARLIRRGYSVLMIGAYNFLQIARKSYFEAENGIKELMEVPVLMLDDLGSEPLMQNITVEQLFQLINERQNRGLSTVISTNLTLKELRERYTERIASRLNDPSNCEIIVLKGKDLRKTVR